MLESTRHNYRLIAILIAAIGAGLPLFHRSSRQLDLLNVEFLLIWILFGVLASVIARFVVNLKPSDMIGSFAAGFVIAVVIHFVSTILLSGYIQAQFALSLLISICAGALSGAIGSIFWIRPKSKG